MRIKDEKYVLNIRINLGHLPTDEDIQAHAREIVQHLVEEKMLDDKHGIVSLGNQLRDGEKMYPTDFVKDMISKMKKNYD